MRSPRFWGNVLGWLVDLAALAVAWYFCAILALMELWRGVKLAELGVMIMIVLIAAANAIWVQIRIAPRMSQLAFKPRREELAVTLIRSREYLIARLKWPLIRVLAPVGSTLPVMIVPLMIDMVWDWGWDWETISILLFILCSVAAGLILSIVGVFDLLIRQCRGRSIGVVSCYIIPFVWSAIAIGAPVVLAYLCGYLFDVIMQLGNDLGITLMVGCMFSLAVFCVWFMIKRWQKAVAVYYRFD